MMKRSSQRTSKLSTITSSTKEKHPLPPKRQNYKLRSMPKQKEKKPPPNLRVRKRKRKTKLKLRRSRKRKPKQLRMKRLSRLSRK